ncbi:hypothetical protein KSS82_09890 [Vibrio mimicus]|nr:hypothetical protein [Vibrio mimicus]QXC58361.1 hypothetical protein KSS82_09890 [Vibrio mimicus]
MKKGESSAVAMLVVLTIVIAPFIWVYNRWGWGGLVLSVILSVVFIVWVVDKFTKPSKKELDLIEHYFYQLFDGSYTYDDKKVFKVAFQVSIK